MEKMEKIRENSTYPHPEWISERVVSLLLSSLILLSSAHYRIIDLSVDLFWKSFKTAK
jgi:hypothetical protein